MQDKLSNLLTALAKTIAHSIVWCTCLKFGKIWWIKKDIYVLSQWTYQRPLTQYTIIWWLPSFGHLASWSPRFSTWENIIAGVPQGPILVLFSNAIDDLFLFVLNSHLRDYSYDSTLYAFGYNLEETKNILHFDFSLVSKYFEENYMKMLMIMIHAELKWW